MELIVGVAAGSQLIIALTSTWGALLKARTRNAAGHSVPRARDASQGSGGFMHVALGQVQTQHTTSIATKSAPYTRHITTSALALQSQHRNANLAPR